MDLRMAANANDLKLLGTKLSSFSHRIEWALKLKGIQYEFIVEDLKNKSPLLLDSNLVHKKVPVLIHGGKPISESLTILEYIDETWKNNPILPESPVERAYMRFWAKFVDEKLYKSFYKAFYSIGEDQGKALDSVAEGLQRLEGVINGKKFFGGEQLGYLDIVCGLCTWFKFSEEAIGIELVDSTKYPSLASWIDK